MGQPRHRGATPQARGHTRGSGRVRTYSQGPGPRPCTRQARGFLPHPGEGEARWTGNNNAEAAAIGSSDVTNERGDREAGRPSRLLTGRGPLAAKGLLPPRLAHGETEAQWGGATAQGHTGAQSDQDTTLLSHPRPSGTICLAWGLWSSEFWVPRGAAGPHPEVPWKVRPGASPLPEETPIPQEPGLCGLRTLTGRGGGAGGQGRGEGRRGRGGGEQEDISPRRGGARSPRPSSELVCAARAAGAHPLRSKGPGRRHGQAHGALALPASFSLWKTRILENLGESGTPGLRASTAPSAARAARGAEGPAPRVPGGQGRDGGVA